MHSGQEKKRSNRLGINAGHYGRVAGHMVEKLKTKRTKRKHSLDSAGIKCLRVERKGGISCLRVSDLVNDVMCN